MNDFAKLITAQGIIPLYYHKDPVTSLSVLRALYNAGIRVVEYVNRGEAALANFKQMRKARDTEWKDLRLGIGTIKDSVTAQTFIDAGADFLISPGLIEEVATLADKNKKPWIPGCMTPSEIIRAETLGTEIIKLFPGASIGPAFLEAIRPVFPGLLFMVTGGVELEKENMAGWLRAGAGALGLGSKLLTNKLLEEKAYEKIEEHTKKAMQLFQSIQSNG